MRTPDDPRHLKRQELVQELFKIDFYPQEISPQAQKIFDQKESIDKAIEEAAPEFPISKINRTDLAILRLAVFELREKKVPARVVIDEAIELAKEFSGESSPAFVNGALGKLVKNIE